ncbi:MAG: DNA primase [Candidatus Dadabacteria bacterium]|nr:DNA primase [Candidatus Dadabacteria bacterium]NIS09324.1 DNA primase [Candidatus Dadabacteria bacterium]NIV42497.1 DNA primase [Candidatus Dadabacteria bacterium]NIX15865.1 DNA primase [Candidatus Dadabacteria bacterium]NIY22574.1 DNA primase [Candidatus Dadabacteria bacterium]
MSQHNDIDIVQNIKDNLSIVDHIQKFISLKNSGRDYLGVCPFHDDHKPSMRVSDDKGLFHCFSCGSGGDIIGFHMKYNNLDFVSALKELADIAGVKMPERSKNTKTKSGSEIYYKINDFAHKMFIRNLKQTDEGKKAAGYIADRGIGEVVIRRFGLGYSKNEWNDLSDRMMSKNVPLKSAEELGLIIKSAKAQSGYYDRFRGRIIFPIFDLNNKVSGFGGRTLFDDDPKYLNSPESPVYNKSSILYGLNETRNDIRKENRVIIVEGYIDLLSLYQNGIKNVVATLGTSLTSNHAKLLKRFCENMVIIYDGDKSGVNASLRALDVFLQHGITPSVVVLPESEDPSSLVEKIGKEDFLNLIKNAKPLIDFYFEKISQEFSSGSRSRNSIIKELVDKLSLYSDYISRSVYTRKAAEMFGLREQEIYSLLKDKSITEKAKPQNQHPESANSYERIFLKVLLHYPDFIEKIREDDIVSLLEEKTLKKIIRICIESDFRDVTSVINHLDDHESRRIISQLLLSREDIENEFIAAQIFEQSYRRIKLQSIKKEQRRIKSRLKNNINSDEPESEIKLLKEYDNLVKQEKNLSEQVHGA